MSAYAELSHAKKELTEWIAKNRVPPYPDEEQETQYRILVQQVRLSEADVNAEAAEEARFPEPEDPGHGGPQ